MTTNEKSQYEKDEEIMIESVAGLMEYYNINLEEIKSILDDYFG